MDAQGNTYLGGFFRKGTVFAAGQPDSVRLEESGAIVVSYDVAGQLRWLRTGGDLGVRADWPSLRPDKMAIPWSLTVSDDGELALGWTVPYGRDGIHVTVGDTAFWSGSGSSGYFELITRHAPDGSLRWVRRLTTNGYVELTEIAMDRQGHVYVGGLYDGHWVQIEDTVLTNGNDSGSRTQTGLLVHYDAEGNVARTLRVTGPRYTRVSGIVPMPGGDLYVAGFARGDRAGPDQIILGMDTLAVGSGRNRGFLAKYGPQTTARENNHERPVNRLQIAHYPKSLCGGSHDCLRASEYLARGPAGLRYPRARARCTRGRTARRRFALRATGRIRLTEWCLPVPPRGRKPVATGRLVRRK